MSILRPSILGILLDLMILKGDFAPSLTEAIVHSMLLPGDVKKRIFGSPYVHFERYLGRYQQTFEVGVVLGYAFRNEMMIFAKLFSKQGHETEIISAVQELAHIALNACSAEPQEFFELAMDQEKRDQRQRYEEVYSEIYRSGRKDIPSRVARFILERRFQKFPLESAVINLEVALLKGVGFGSAFPRLTEKLWHEVYESHVDPKSYQAIRVALKLPEEPPEPVSLAQRQRELLPPVKEYVSKVRPELVSQFQWPESFEENEKVEGGRVHTGVISGLRSPRLHVPEEREGESPSDLQWVGDGKSQQTAIFFTNASGHLQHILFQHQFVRDQGIGGIRYSVAGDDQHFYDVWRTPEGELWFKVPVDPDPSQTRREMEELLKTRRGSFVEFEARVRELQSQNSSEHQVESRAEGEKKRAELYIGLRPPEQHPAVEGKNNSTREANKEAKENSAAARLVARWKAEGRIKPKEKK